MWEEQTNFGADYNRIQIVELYIYRNGDDDGLEMGCSLRCF